MAKKKKRKKRKRETKPRKKYKKRKKENRPRKKYKKRKKETKPRKKYRKRKKKIRIRKRSFRIRKKEPAEKIVAEISAKPLILADEMVHRTKIRVIGIGGGAGSIVSEIAPDIKKADFIVANTDIKSLNELANKVKRFQFGQSLTRGNGTGMNDQLGESAALNEKESIKKLLKGQDLCIIVSCLGGGTSSGATPVFAKISKNLGILTFGIFTLPFEFEGERKKEMAQSSLEKIKPFLNAYSVIPNERIFQIIDKDAPLKSAFSAINKRLADNLEGLIEMIYFPGLINIDFMDLEAVLSGSGKLSYLNTTEMEGLSEEDSVKKVISSSLYPYTIKGAKGILYNIKGGAGLKLTEVSHISKIISDSINRQAKIIFGITQNKNLKDKIKITLLAVGCGQKIALPKLKSKKSSNMKKVAAKELKPEKKKIAKKIKTAKVKSVEKKTGRFEPQDLIPKEVRVKVRRNGLELKRAVEEAEKEILDQEKMWETPAIFRKANSNDTN